ncbi:hypothetical protein LZC94_19560 [Pendulispora albinea]|uniref:Uncharacterized protein n=1 Tax=Pendulispora albinea TaxID=2741071 RepID=A0ABZ2MA95_9BACT
MVRARIDRGAKQLLGRHVAGSACDARRRIVLRIKAPERPCDSKVCDLDGSRAGEEDVLWFHVPMDDALIMGMRERLRHLDQPSQPLGLTCIGGHGVSEVSSVAQFEDQVRKPPVISRIVNLDDVRMPERRGDARLMEKAPLGLLAVRRGFGGIDANDFERNGTLKGLVFRAVNFTHGATTEELLDPVAIGEHGARRQPRVQMRSGRRKGRIRSSLRSCLVTRRITRKVGRRAGGSRRDVVHDNSS